MKRTGSAGFSLVEVILAVALLALFATAYFGALQYSLQTTLASGMRGRALLLAEEGLEAARNISTGNFAALTDGMHGLMVSGNVWTFSGTSDTTDTFTRTVSVSSVDAVRKRITSVVSWYQTPSRTGSVSLDTYIARWSAPSGVAQCSSYCQSLLYSAGTCRQNATLCTTNGETHVIAGDAYCTGGPSANTCCCHP